MNVCVCVVGARSRWGYVQVHGEGLSAVPSWPHCVRHVSGVFSWRVGRVAVVTHRCESWEAMAR